MEQTTIGTYNEKTIHSLLKKRYEPNENFHEIRYKNYIADIKNGSSIYEIQSAQFYRMRDKIKAFTEDNNELTVVFPIPHEKNIVWVDPDTGESSTPRRSPKKGSEYNIFNEIYTIRDMISNPRLGFIAILMDIIEYRYLSSRKNRKDGAKRAERIPVRIVKEVRIKEKKDYSDLIPENIGEEFTVKEFAAAAKIPASLAQKTIYIMRLTGSVALKGKSGRKYVYKRN